MNLNPRRSLFVFGMVLVAPMSLQAQSTGQVQGSLLGLGRGPFIIYVDKAAGASAPTAGAMMNQKGNTYVPHILPVVAGSEVSFHSEDPELHNIYAFSKALDMVLFNAAIPPASPPQKKVFSRPGEVHLTCNIHKEMEAWILVLQNSHFVQTEKGAENYTLAGLPAGAYDIRVWGEKLDPALKAKKYPVTLAAGKTVKIDFNPEGGAR